jgi:hypothetical protein
VGAQSQQPAERQNSTQPRRIEFDDPDGGLDVPDFLK